MTANADDGDNPLSSAAGAYRTFVHLARARRLRRTIQNRRSLGVVWGKLSLAAAISGGSQALQFHK